MGIKIKGLEKSDTRYAILKRNIETISASYNMKEIKIDIDVTKNDINPDAQTLFRKTLRMPLIVLDFPEDELKSILAHEFSHLSHRDNIVQYFVFFSFVAPLLIIIYVIFPYFFEKINLFLVMCISLLFPLIIVVFGLKIMNWVSNKHEIRADRDALLKTGNMEAMLNVISKLRNHAGEKRPSYFIRAYGYFCGYAHPTWKERIKSIRLTNKIIDTKND